MSDYEVAKQGGQTVVFFGDDHSGISLRINKGVRTISVFGWYDSMVGIAGGEIALADLLVLFERERRP